MKRIICLIIFIFLLSAGAVFAGQEESCEHDNYIITYNSNEEAIRMFCNDCGESHSLKIDSYIIEKIFGEMWRE